jgi:hypothetical protein
MKSDVYGQLMVGFVAVVTMLMVSAQPSYAWTGGGTWGVHGGGFHQGAFHHGFHQFHHGFHHRPVFFHRACCFGPRVFVGFGVGVPFVYPYAYPYPYSAYSPPAVMEASPQVYSQQDRQPPQQYWYYCQGAQAYYPYVKDCPGGWLQVVPQPSPPPQSSSPPPASG